MSVKTYWNNYWFKEHSPVDLGIFRFLFFTFGTLFVAWTSGAPQSEGFYEKWDPISFYQVLDGPLSPVLLRILFYSWMAFSLFAGLGIWYRATALISFIAGLVFLGHGYNFGFVYHSSHIYIMTMAFMVFAKADHAFALGRSRSDSMSSDYHWPLALTRTYVVWVFFICGLEKLYYGGGLDWAFSEAMTRRLVVVPHQTVLAQWLLLQPLWITQGLAAFGLIVAELCAPLALFHRRLGQVFVVIWMTLHFGTCLMFGSHMSFFSQTFSYFAFLPLRNSLPDFLFSERPK